MVIEKTCPKCKLSKNINDFYLRKDTLKYRVTCKLCFVQDQLNSTTKKINEGNCKKCSNQRMQASSLCFKHYVINLLQLNKIKAFDSLADALIDKLYKQRFECYYTGVLLIPGVNASLDHIVPLSKEGQNTEGNFVWCDSSINRMKQNIEQKEFINRYSDRLTEFNLLHTFDGFKNNLQKLSYVLGSDFALNTIIG